MRSSVNNAMRQRLFTEYLNEQKQNKMKTLQINIGLNNNPFTAEEVIDYIASNKEYRLIAYQIVDAEFKGNVEPTFVGLLEYNYSRQSKILSDFENIASVMTQESIALVTDKMQVLAFNPSYEGDGYEFDSQYFKSIKL
jgi:hypothetical protein